MSIAEQLKPSLLPWMTKEDEELIEREGLPTRCELEPEIPEPELRRRFIPAANDTFTDLLVIGWSKGALDAIASDTVLRDKTFTWLVRPDQVAWVTEAMETWRPTRIRLALCDDKAQLPILLERMPICWSLAILDDALCPSEELILLGRTRYTRSSASIERAVGDARHMWHRLPHLSEAIPLGHFQNMYKGRSALCLAAGPTLDEHMDFIRQHQDRCVVIIVDVLQIKLQEAGIKVDFVLTVDSDETLNVRLTDPTDPHQVLIMPLMGHRDLDKKFPLRSYFGGGNLGGILLGKQTYFQTGTTVGTASIGFASFLGCQEAVLIGHDLSYDEGKLYSAFVKGREEQTAYNLGIAAASRRQVPGNSGELVGTDYLFEVGIQDLGMMLRVLNDFKAYNVNINSKKGAIIPNTLALPNEWTPALTDASPRPDVSVRVGDSALKDAQTSLKKMLKQQFKNLAAGWESGLEKNIGPMHIEERLTDDARTVIGTNYARYFLLGPILCAMRLLSMPPSISTTWHRSVAKQCINHAVAKGAEFWESVFTENNEKPLEGLFVSPGYSPEQVSFFAAISVSIKEDARHPSESLLLPVMAKGYRDIRRALPAVSLPVPQSAQEGLLTIKHMGETVSRSYLIQTLCLCIMEQHDAPLRWAMSSRILPHELIPGSGKQGKRGEYVELDATNALLRLRMKSIDHINADISLACAWTPCHIHLIRALLDLGETGIAHLERIIKRRDIILDDQKVSLVMLHTSDFGRACRMVAPFGSVIGEATSIAMATRHLEEKDYDRALLLAERVRPMSRFRDQALGIAAAIYHVRGDQAGVEKCAQEMLNPDMAEQARHQAHQISAGWRGSFASIKEKNAPPMPGILAQLISSAWEERDGAALEAILRFILSFREDERISDLRLSYLELTQHLDTMLGKLGIDTQIILREVMTAKKVEEPIPAREEFAQHLAAWVGKRFNAGIPIEHDRSLIYSGFIDSLGMAELAVELTRIGKRDISSADIVEHDLDSVQAMVVYLG